MDLLNLLKSSPEEGVGGFQRGTQDIKLQKKELTNSQMCSSDQRICGQKGSSRGNKAER